MKPYSFFGLLLLLSAVLLAFYSLASWTHRFAAPAVARIEAHTRYLAVGQPLLPKSKTPIGLMQPRYVRVELPERG